MKRRAFWWMGCWGALAVGCQPSSPTDQGAVDGDGGSDTDVVEDTDSPVDTDPLPGDTADTSDPSISGPLRVLFVGNSFTYWNGGLDAQLEKLTDDPLSTITVDADREVQGGASLKVMWEWTNAVEVIEEGDYDVVVLQEDIPETDVETFYEYARLFVPLIRDSGAEPVFFMAWPYQRLNWIDLDEIASAHEEMGTELGVDVAPVAVAWDNAMTERPDLDMYGSDAEHPSRQGTYLAVNVVYATLTNTSPEGLAYRPGNVTEQDATFLQEIAWQTVQDPP